MRGGAGFRARSIRDMGLMYEVEGVDAEEIEEAGVCKYGCGERMLGVEADTGNGGP